MTAPVQPSLYTYRAFVRKVYDGDTVTLDIDLGFDVVLREQKVRLLRINAPEVRGEERELGLTSRDALRKRIANKWVVLRTERDKKEKFGRWLGEIWFEGECVNDWMLAEGHARVYGEGE
jgi:micrococcal nuclease